jgi:hypothetical protein
MSRLCCLIPERLPRLGWQRNTPLPNQLGGHCRHTSLRTRGIRGFFRAISDCFHVADKGSIVLWGHTPCLLLPGLTCVFFHVCLIVSWDTESTISNATLVSASMRNVPVACPSGAGLQHKALQWASSSPVMFRRWTLGTGFRERASSRPSSTHLFLTHSTFFVDTSYAWAISSSIHPHATSDLRRIEACTMAYLLAVFFERIALSFLRSSSVHSTIYLTAMTVSLRLRLS